VNATQGQRSRQRRVLVLQALDKLGLLRPASWAQREWILRRGGDPDEDIGDELPIPPARLRVTTCHNPDRDEFLRGGARTAKALGDAATTSGRNMESMESILDFGCGCGRVARHWQHLEGPAINGCDYNPKLVEWCASNLPFLRCAQNELAPPLPYESESFDLVYSISVLTHLALDLQRAWVEELRRVLKPGGLLLITMHGTHHAEQDLPPRELSEFRAGRPVVTFSGHSGENRCSSYMPTEFVQDNLLAGFEPAGFWPVAEVPEVGQDLYSALRLPA
jgi:SAM-dependent methyltransferase